jgi:hypothetical protein
MTKQRRVLTGLMTALLVMGWFLTAGTAARSKPPAAQAEPTTLASCYGPSCAGWSPVTMGCVRDQRTQASIVVYGASGREFLVEHRYSAACYASWTRLSNRGSNPDCSIGTYAFHQGWWTGGSRPRTPAVTVAPNCGAYTVMMSEHNKSSRACAYSAWEGLTRCTGWKLPG